MAYADAVNSGVAIDDDRHAYHTLIRSGLTDDQINRVCGFVFDPAITEPKKVLEAVMTFHDKPWDVDRHRDVRSVMGRYPQPLWGVQISRSSHSCGKSARKGKPKGSCIYESWDDENYVAEDGCGNDNDRYTDVPSDSHRYPYTSEDPTDWPAIDFGTFLAGDQYWVRRDEIDAGTLGAHVEEEGSIDAQLHEVYVGHRTHQLNQGPTWLLACCGDSISRRADRHPWHALACVLTIEL